MDTVKRAVAGQQQVICQRRQRRSRIVDRQSDQPVIAHATGEEVPVAQLILDSSAARAQAFAAFAQPGRLLGDLLELLRLTHRGEHCPLRRSEGLLRGTQRTAARAACCSSKAGGSVASA
jgi:hypothetical protein